MREEMTLMDAKGIVSVSNVATPETQTITTIVVDGGYPVRIERLQPCGLRYSVVRERVEDVKVSIQFQGTRWAGDTPRWTYLLERHTGRCPLPGPGDCV